MARSWVAAWLSVGVTLVALDLLFLGVLAADFFNNALGPLRAREVNVLAAGLFYVMYVSAITGFAVSKTSSAKDAAKRGAWMGAFAYSTYELTNWAVLEGWPAKMVPVDIVWGVVLTASCGFVGRLAWNWSAKS